MYHFLIKTYISSMSSLVCIQVQLDYSRLIWSVDKNTVVNLVINVKGRPSLVIAWEVKLQANEIYL